ncbi:MATE family efflux transporter [Oceanicoccus sp. KOV_DT_Chl]|uniref:MATE family efflux transporter n=1 Tax=Oceanicoccus sp. KOV_DT_Chl TaxID=1904639 RepID=UPI000C7D6C9B|nr:MATE family efflux transporter [Oceanicoccus sp. KOV_DT_Chl]
MIKPLTHKQGSWREVWALAAPSSAVFFMVTLANLATIKIVAPLGADALAAVTTGARLYNIFNAVMIGLSAGTLALISRSWGANNKHAAASLLSTSLLISLLIGISMTALMLLSAPALVSLLGLSHSAYTVAVDYVRWFSLFYTPIAAYIILAAGLRAAGDARSPMIFAALINLLIVLLGYWLTYGGLGMPAYGVTGTAIGSGLGNLLGVLVAFWYWQQQRLPLKPTHINSAQRKLQMQQLWKLGYPAAMEQGVMQIGFIGFLWVVGHYGTAAYAAYGTGVTLLSLSMVIGFGFSIAGSILVGQQLGANNIEGAKAAGWRAMWQSIIILVVLSLIMASFASPLAHWLVHDEEVAGYTVLFIYVFCLAQPFIAIDMALGGALRGAGDTRFPLYAAIAGLIIIRFGLAIIFMWLEFSVVWIYGAVIGDYVVKNILFIWRFKSGHWIKHLPNNHPPIDEDLITP